MYDFNNSEFFKLINSKAMAGMSIDFNNVRRQAMVAYDKLCHNLNSETRGGTVEIDVRDIQEHMDDLRTLIGAIAMTYEDGNNDFKDVYSERYPIDSEKRMLEFNPQP